MNDDPQKKILLRDGADPALVDRFFKYHRGSPKVWDLFKDYAEEAYRSGRNNFSAWAIINRVRWDHEIEKREEFKISNDYIALYSRMLVAGRPKFRGFFRLRPLKHEKEPELREPTRPIPEDWVK